MTELIQFNIANITVTDACSSLHRQDISSYDM